MIHRYVMVIQFEESYFPNIGELQAFEEKLIASMPRTCAVDGHDVGSGTTNFFVMTNAPLAAHRAFRKYLGTRARERKVRVAFRMGNKGPWMNLWPFRDPRPFALAYARGTDPFKPSSKRAIPKRSKPGESKFVTPAKRGG